MAVVTGMSGSMATWAAPAARPVFRIVGVPIVSRRGGSLGFRHIPGPELSRVECCRGTSLRVMKATWTASIT